MRLWLTSITLLVLIRTAVADSKTPPVAKLDVTDVVVSQSAGEVRIPVSVSGPPLSDFFGTTVQWKATQGTATWPRDFNELTGSLKFHPGETAKEIIIGLPIAPAFKGDRVFSVRIETYQDYNVGTPSVAAITIIGGATQPTPTPTPPATPTPTPTPPSPEDTPSGPPPTIFGKTKVSKKGVVTVTVTSRDFRGSETRKVFRVRPKNR